MFFSSGSLSRSFSFTRGGFLNTFATKVTECFVLGVVFFFTQISNFQVALFDGIFTIFFRKYCCP